MEQTLCNDILFIICQFIDNEKNLIHFLSSCRYLNGFKNKIKINFLVPLEKIYNLPYYDNFTNIRLSKLTNKFMKRIEHLPKNAKKLTVTDYMGSLHFIENSNLTHLYLLEKCSVGTKRLVFPTTLIHLSWHIEQVQHFPFFTLPKSLVELDISNYKHKYLKIPNSVTKLVLGDNNKYLYKNIILSADHININDTSSNIIFIELPRNLYKLEIKCDNLHFLELPKNLHELVIDRHKNLFFYYGQYYSLTDYIINVKTLVLKKTVFLSPELFPNLIKILIDKTITDIYIYPFGPYASQITYLDYIKSLNFKAQIVVF